MAGIFGAWVAAVALSYLGEQLGKRGSALISVIGFFAASSAVVTLKLVEPLTAERLRASTREARDLFELTTQPIPSMILGACLVIGMFGPFVWAIRAEAPPPPEPEPERRAPEF